MVGTHALFQDAVVFQRLGLIIIDEQHRFGVQQRLALREKGRFGNQVPHQLTLTATPIPRTLAMSVYGDLDTSVIDEMPPGRKPIQTLALPTSRRDDVVAVHAAHGGHDCPRAVQQKRPCSTQPCEVRAPPCTSSKLCGDRRRAAALSRTRAHSSKAGAP